MKITYWSYFRKRNGSTVLYDEGARNSSWLSPALLRVFFFSFLKKIYLFMAVLGLRCCTQAFSRCSEWGLLFVAVRRLLTAVASLLPSTSSRHLGFISCVLRHVESSWTRGQIHAPCIGRQILYHWATREAFLCVFVLCVVIIQQRHNSFVSDQNKLKTFIF